MCLIFLGCFRLPSALGISGRVLSYNSPGQCVQICNGEMDINFGLSVRFFSFKHDDSTILTQMIKDYNIQAITADYYVLRDKSSAWFRFCCSL